MRIRRRQFMGTAGLVLGGWLAGGSGLGAEAGSGPRRRSRRGERGFTADAVVIGGGLGGCAAALALLRQGLKVVLTEETDWLGGQLTSQGVPPDEHRWIESFGCTRSYRELRQGIRDYYRRHYPLTDAARGLAELNPGAGAVSRLCHEPRVAVAVLESMLAPYVGSGRVRVLLEHRPAAVEFSGDRVQAVQVRDLRSGAEVVVEAPWFVDATELGDLLPMAGVEHRVGAEAREETGEMHAAERADGANQQAFTVCLAMDHLRGTDQVGEKPRGYDYWRSYVPRLRPAWPGRLLDLSYSHPQTLQPRRLGFDPEGPTPGAPLNLWVYRRLAARSMFRPGVYAGDISLMNWPQNDYLGGNLVGVTDREFKRHVEGARQLSLALFYWLQTEAPRGDGGRGWPGLRLRGDVLGTSDGLAKYPYVRESRRIRALFTVTERQVGRRCRAELLGVKEAEVRAEAFGDSVGIGSYAIDLHPTSAGDNYIDFASLPFQIPLGSLLPVRVRNLVAACKNIGTTHVTNGCYRLHPVEWNIGEAAGAVVGFAAGKRTTLEAVREDAGLLRDFQALLVVQGVELAWPERVYGEG